MNKLIAFVVNGEEVTWWDVVHLMLCMFKINQMNCTVEVPLLTAGEIWKTMSALDICAAGF